ncbi:Uncharacterised protein [Streptococcus pneumoniae]|nr:Uncharacterised protein [Streptococcus pneumoniae]CIV95402.1 Uncharacterised protein [Streptococcus pneumoniae]
MDFHGLALFTRLVKKVPNLLFISLTNGLTNHFQTFLEILNSIQNGLAIGQENGGPHSWLAFRNSGHISKTTCRKAPCHLMLLSIDRSLLHETRSQNMRKMANLRSDTIMLLGINLDKTSMKT